MVNAILNELLHTAPSVQPIYVQFLYSVFQFQVDQAPDPEVTTPSQWTSLSTPSIIQKLPTRGAILFLAVLFLGCVKKDSNYDLILLIADRLGHFRRNPTELDWKIFFNAVTQFQEILVSLFDLSSLSRHFLKSFFNNISLEGRRPGRP